MIGVDGQYLFSFDVSNFVDFITPEHLIDATIIETAGNQLPVMELEFFHHDDAILPYLNEQEVVEVKFGSDLNKLASAPFAITSFTYDRVGKSKFQIRISAVFDALNYLISSNKFTSENTASSRVLKLIAQRHFSRVTTNFDISYDRQYWINPNTSDKAFINEMWSRMDLQDSYPLVGITTQGEFRLRDANKLFDTDPVFSLTHVRGIEGAIIVSPDYGFVDRTTMNNYLHNYDVELVQQMVKSGVTKSIDYNSSRSLGSDLNKSQNITKRVTAHRQLTSNTHSKYNWDRLHNISKITSLSNNSVTLSVENQFIPFKVLDLVEFFEDNTKSEQSNTLSGKYLISTVSRSVQSNRYSTTLELSRDSQIRG